MDSLLLDLQMISSSSRSMEKEQALGLFMMRKVNSKERYLSKIIYTPVLREKPLVLDLTLKSVSIKLEADTWMEES